MMGQIRALRFFHTTLIQPWTLFCAVKCTKGRAQSWIWGTFKTHHPDAKNIIFKGLCQSCTLKIDIAFLTIMMPQGTVTMEQKTAFPKPLPQSWKQHFKKKKKNITTVAAVVVGSELKQHNFRGAMNTTSAALLSTYPTYLSFQL